MRYLIIIIMFFISCNDVGDEAELKKERTEKAKNPNTSITILDSYYGDYLLELKGHTYFKTQEGRLYHLEGCCNQKQANP